MKYAAGFDELVPKQKKGYNWGSGSLLITPIDAYDTLYLLGLEKEAAQAKALIFENINFDQAIDVSVFETTVRVLGGLLGAYTVDGDKEWINLAKQLGDLLLNAFYKRGEFPLSRMILNKTAMQPNINQIVNLAEMGSIQLEFQYLSDLTGDSKYKNAALEIYDILFSMDRVYTGIFPIQISPDRKKFVEPFQYGLGAYSDSFYEYLLKMWMMTGNSKLREIYDSFTSEVDSVIVRRSGDRKRTWADMPGHPYQFDHLSCFAGGMLLLGESTKPSEKMEMSTLAKELIDTCVNSYKISKSGLGGDRVDGISNMIISDSYPLRPETIESIFYMIRLGKDLFPDDMANYRSTVWQIYEVTLDNPEN